MEEEYWHYILENLNGEELELLRILLNTDATARYRGMSNPQLQERSGFSPSRYRITITRLDAMRLVEVISGTREHTVFINRYGRNALSYFED